MTPFVEELNFLLALGTIGMQIATVTLIALLFLEKKNSDYAVLGNFVRRFGLHIGFLIALGSTIMSLYYSEVLGFIPCFLCWLQRIFIYPLVVLFGIAIWKKDSRIADYVIGLSIVGFCIALYQHFLQMMGHGSLPCPSSGGDCAQRILFEFGYITFPLIAVSSFALLIVLMLFVRRQNIENQ